VSSEAENEDLAYHLAADLVWELLGTTGCTVKCERGDWGKLSARASCLGESGAVLGVPGWVEAWRAGNLQNCVSGGTCF